MVCVYMCVCFEISSVSPVFFACKNFFLHNQSVLCYWGHYILLTELPLYTVTMLLLYLHNLEQVTSLFTCSF